MAANCYHCGLQIPADAQFPVQIEGVQREMCCTGCQAVASAIVDGGHASYYRHRDALPDSPREALPSSLKDLGLFDHPDVQKSFVRPLGDHEREASLILEGITCAACVWLNESHLSGLKGVLAVNINYSTRRARIRWDDRLIHLSQILAAIASIGYRAHPYDTGKMEKLAQEERKAALWRVFVAGFGMMQVMMYAIPVYLADDGTMTPDIERLMRWASLILTLPVVLYSSAPFFRSALRDLLLRRIGMDVPVALGIGAAFLASLLATVSGTGEVYFDSVTMFVFFLLGGRYLEMAARQKAARGVETLAKATPSFAMMYLAYPNGETEQVVASSLTAGSHVLVRPGESFPADGQVVEGESAADESLLTGESLPVHKRIGDLVIGGALNVGSPLVVRVTRVGEETRLASIQRLMEQAAMEKPRLVQAADRVASRFLFVLILLAVVATVAWQFIDPSKTLLVFVSVLVVSCPCALSLATPTVLTVATGAMAAKGVLVVKGHGIETLARTTLMVFDKTGTLSHGRLSVVESFWPDGGRQESGFGPVISALERQSEHPVAKALVAAMGDVLPAEMDGINAVTGRGITGQFAGNFYRLGTLEYCAEGHGQEAPLQIKAWVETGRTVVAFANQTQWLGFFALMDVPRESAQGLVSHLASLGVSSCILSGDSPQAAQAMGRLVGIGDVYGGLSPEGKHQRIKAFQEQGLVVAMVGDGVNDAPVLAQAQVSIAMGSGTDLARAQADMVLLGENLDAIADAIAMARKTVKIVRQNLIWAFAYNFTAIPLAMSGLVTPWMAGIGMSASSLLVVLNALRLQKVANTSFE